MSKSKAELGKGIRALLNNIDDDIKKNTNSINTPPTQIVGEKIPVEFIEPNPYQPRKDFDQESLEELAESIRLHDIIQPITVTKISPVKYQLIAGERRWRASKLAGLKEIPAFIRKANDQEKLEWGLLENLQREDLNAIEIALGYKHLMEEVNLTQEQVAERMKKDRSTVTNYLRLLKLPPNIQVAVRNNDISMGHARVISGVSSIEHQLFLYDEIIKKGLSVRQTESLAKEINQAKPTNKSTKTGEVIPSFVRQAHDLFEDFFETKITVKHSKDGKGAVLIDFYSEEDLNRLVEKLLS